MSIPGKSGEAGFTLVELALVMVLIALFAGLTLPMLTGIGEDPLASSARRLAGTVKFLYNESALTNHQYRLVYNLDKGIFLAKRLETDGELTEVEGVGRRQELKGSARFKDLELPGRGKFTSGEVTTEIHPVGWIEETIIHLADQKERMLTLRINPFTGSTEVYEGYREFSE